MSSENRTIKLKKNGFQFSSFKMMKDKVQRWTCYENSCKNFFKLSTNNVNLENCLEHNREKCEENCLVDKKLVTLLKEKL